MRAATYLLFLCLTGCKALAAAAPSAIADIACVLDDLEKPISQIVLDCGGDTAQVIAIIVDSTNYAKVNGTPAYAEAGRVKLVLSKSP
jgi:hypothetical protein